MNKRTKRMIVNWMMLISLIVVFVTGILLKPFPGMWMGIAHGLSRFMLVISAVMHCIQQKMFRKLH